MKFKRQGSSDTPPAPGAASALKRDALVSLILCLAVVAGAFYWLINIEQPRVQDQRIRTVTAAGADQQAQAVREVIEQFKARVSSQATLPELQSSGDSDRTLLEDRIQRAFPNAISAQLIALGEQGTADENSEIGRLRNHIEIDLLNRAIASGKAEIEAYQQDKTWLISSTALATPRLALFVTVPATSLGNLLGGETDSGISQQLVQTYKNRRGVILSTGQLDPHYREQRKLPVPGWTLEVAAKPSLIAMLATDTTLLWLLCALCIAAISASHSIFLLSSGLGLPRVKKADKVAKEPKPSRFSLFKRKAKTADAPAQTPSAQAETPTVTIPQQPSGPAADFVSSSPPLPELDEGKQNHTLAINAFRAYDIRGVADRDLDDHSCELIGQAMASEAIARGESSILVGRDGRLSSPRIHRALLTGLCSTGIRVVDLGLVATPMLQYACRALKIGNGVMVTGSHNPGDHNGMKLYLQYTTLSAEDIQGLRRRIEAADFVHGTPSEAEQNSIEQRYIERVIGDVVIAHSLKVVVDAGNGATSNVAPELFSELGCEVIPLFCDIDGYFPNHAPDPTRPDNLVALKAAVQEHQADIGLAFDGDGDRVAVVTAAGACPAADELLTVLANDIVSRNPGAEILFDVKCSRNLQKRIVDNGGQPHMCRSGHAYMKAKMLETGAPLGGEFSGHIFFNERWYGFDDGMYAAARLLEVLTLSDITMDDALAENLKLSSTGEILLPVDDNRKFELVEQFKQRQNFADASIVAIDGLRVDFRNGWGLLRASNTVPALSLRFEAETDVDLAEIKQSFAQLLGEIDPQLADSL